MTIRRKAILSVLAVLAALLIAAAAGADQDGDKKTKSQRDWPAVNKDIKEGKAKKIKAAKRTTGVWNACKFVYLKTDETTYEFDDGSVATVSENPEPLPPRQCDERHPTEAEFAEMEARVEAANAGNRAPGAPPPPPLPADRYKGGVPPLRGAP
jgi:hypothetical protein